MKKTKKVSKKKSKKEEVKEERLEEEIREAEKEIENEIDFFDEPRTIPIQQEVKAPVLERIIQRETPMPVPIEPQGEEREEEKRINYSVNEPQYNFARNAKEDEEKKYETNFVPPVLTRQEFSEEGMRREFLKSPEQAWQNQGNESQLSDLDFIESETRLPFEEQQKKYKRAKLR